MSTFLYGEINIVGAVILLLLLNNMSRSGFKNIPTDQRIFNGIMFLNLLIFIFDMGMWLVDGNPFWGFRIVNYVATTLYYILNPLICFLWVMYTDFKIYESRFDLLKRTRLYIIPAIVSSIMSLLSPFTKWFFIIDEGNRYVRGPLFLVMAFISFFYLVLSCGMPLKDLYKNGWEENKSINLHLIIFPIGMIAVATIQTLFFGVSIIWICSMLICTNIYINIQNAEISTDHLTGLYNRRRLDQHLQRRIKAKCKGHLLFAIILDLDEFKSINDNLGHMVGDNALFQTAELLRQSCKGSDDFIARIGGDEFVIVGERAEFGEIDKLIKNILSHALKYNQSSQSNFNLLLSMGYSVFSKDDTIDSFLAAADKKMYQNKKERKLERLKEFPSSNV